MDLSYASEKIPGIDPGTFRLVAQRLNHYTTPGPSILVCAKMRSSACHLSPMFG